MTTLDPVRVNKLQTLSSREFNIAVAKAAGWNYPSTNTNGVNWAEERSSLMCPPSAILMPAYAKAIPDFGRDLNAAVAAVTAAGLGSDPEYLAYLTVLVGGIEKAVHADAKTRMIAYILRKQEMN